MKLIKATILSIISYFLVILYSKIFGSESSKNIIKKRLEAIKQDNRNLEEPEDIMDLSFEERFLKPLINKLIKSVATLLPIREESQIKLGEKLSKAGIRMNPKDYRAMNVIIIFSIAFISGYSAKSKSIIRIIFRAIIGAGFAYFYRISSLENKINLRKKNLRSQLPEVMDILNVSVVAGLSFDQSLGYVVEKAKGPLIDEFDIARREIALGKSRKRALTDLSNRCEVEEINSFTSAVIQAEELGVSLQNVLDSQSKMIRENMKQELEEKAAKIPVKILLPMVLFIFPVIFIVLLGPAIPRLMEALGN